ncbi:MAG: COX15/CtaA family protein, partial [Gemmatimonadota bacterium]|jgi:heme A synthase
MTTDARPGAGDAEGNAARRRLGRLAAFAAAYTWLLVVFGGIVRITGSGLGCGDDWPRCHGEWIPPFTLETVIEYTHRLLAAGIGMVVLLVLGYAFLRRNAPGMRGRDGLLGPSALAAVLVVVQALLGAVTVWLELPTAVTVAHFVTAMLFSATLITISVRAGVLGGPAASPGSNRAARIALLTAGTGLVVVALGAVVANTPGASGACTGFPLCNGRWLPQAGAPTVLIQWLHRLAAFALLAVVLVSWVSTRRAAPGAAVRRASSVAAVLVLAQIVVAAGLVEMRLPQFLQATHLAFGAAIWFVLVAWTTLARREARAAATP